LDQRSQTDSRGPVTPGQTFSPNEDSMARSQIQ
jgi:hypothetical protein